MKGRRRLALGVCLLGQAGAAFITGTLNLSSVPAEADLPCLTFMGTGTSSAAPTPVSADQAEAQRQLADLESQLKTLTPGSEGYTQMNQMLDLARTTLGASALRPGTGGGKPQTYRQLTAKQAVGNLYVSLAYRVSPKAWQSFRNADSLSDPGRARVVATAAVVRGRPLAAVAAYLRVLEKHPKDADTLYNLGALAAFLNAPNEALALLAASEANGGPKSDFYPARAQFLSTLGYALLGVGRSAEATKVLQEAVKLSPQFPEALRNLAAALGNQGQCAAAKKALGLSFRRSVAAQKASTAKPDPEGPLLSESEDPVQPPTASDTGEQIRLVRDTLDFGRGRVGKWPYFPVNVEPEEEEKLGRMVAEYTAWTEQITGNSLIPVVQRNHTFTLDASAYIISLATSDPASHARSFLLGDAVRQLYFYPRPSYRAASVLFRQAQSTYNQGELDAKRVLGQKIQNSQNIRAETEKGCPKARDTTYCYKKAEYDDMARQCPAIRSWNNLWRGAIPSLENPARARVAELDRYFTTVLTYIGSPRLYGYVQNHHALLRRWQMGTVPTAILGHLGDLQAMRHPCVYLATTPSPTPNEALGAYETVDVSPCKPVATYKAKALIFEASMNCEKVGFELSAEIPFLDVGVYVNVEEKSSAGKQKPPSPKDKFLTGQGIVNPERIQKFGETGKSNITTFGGGVGVKVGAGALGSGVEGKAGFYVQGDGQGNVGDVGAKVESSATVGGEVDVGVGEIGVGVEFEGPGASVSFVPSVDGP